MSSDRRDPRSEGEVEKFSSLQFPAVECKVYRRVFDLHLVTKKELRAMVDNAEHAASQFHFGIAVLSATAATTVAVFAPAPKWAWGLAVAAGYVIGFYLLVRWRMSKTAVRSSVEEIEASATEVSEEHISKASTVPGKPGVINGTPPQDESSGQMGVPEPVEIQPSDRPQPQKRD